MSGRDPQSAAPAPSAFQQSVAAMLGELDPEPGREGLLDTPRRVEKAFRFYTAGYQQDPKKVIGDALFEAETDEMVVVKDIEMYSLCEHHLAPFFGKAHVAYIPSGKIVGLSKLARVVEIYARRLQVQERLTMQVAHAIDDVLQPRGVAVVIEAQHLCMMMRGVEKQNSRTITSCLLGLFRKDERTRSEFLQLVRD
ncbi:MAG: GTP cyclohydrolase I FolE [Planctomycetes bacterium]|nr:GTP cyclohydrolase I FolE [Planctomycetota bacterium]